MSKNYPDRILQIIRAGNKHGLSAVEITDKVNSSKTAKKLRHKFSVRSVAAVLGNIRKS